MVTAEFILLSIVLIVVVLVTILTHKLTVAAAVTAGILAIVIFVGSGYTGIALLSTFFGLGTMATSWGLPAKQKLGFAENSKGKRNTAQVLANGGAAGLLAFAAILFPQHQQVFTLMIAGCFASATADTLSSEMGNVYGTNFYNIITLKKDTRGLDGVVSVEGTLIGLFGSIIIAIVYSMSSGFSIAFLLICIGGTAGNLFDSILGATIERRNVLHNNAVNLLNTACGALVVLLCSALL
jgi:uncharacterized protein (TIGR00297 family)